MSQTKKQVVSSNDLFEGYECINVNYNKIDFSKLNLGKITNDPKYKPMIYKDKQLIVVGPRMSVEKIDLQCLQCNFIPLYFSTQSQSQSQSQNQSQIDFFMNCDEWIINRLISTFPDIENIFVQCFRRSCNSNSIDNIYLRNICTSDTIYFNEYNNKIDVNTINNEINNINYVVPLLCPRFKNTVGVKYIEWVVLQLKIYLKDDTNSICLIRDFDEIETETKNSKQINTDDEADDDIDTL